MLSDLLKSNHHSKVVNTLPILLKPRPKRFSIGTPLVRRQFEPVPPVFNCTDPPKVSLPENFELIHVHCTSWSDNKTNFIVVDKSRLPMPRIVKVDGKETLVTQTTTKLALSKDEFFNKFGFIPKDSDTELDALMERIREHNRKDKQNDSQSETFAQI